MRIARRGGAGTTRCHRSRSVESHRILIDRDAKVAQSWAKGRHEMRLLCREDAWVHILHSRTDAFRSTNGRSQGESAQVSYVQQPCGLVIPPTDEEATNEAPMFDVQNADQYYTVRR